MNNQNMFLSMYIHIPFCISKCRYCDFYSIPTLNNGLYKSYTDSLVNQIKHEAPKHKNRKINTIYIGGGTPSLLPAEEFARIFKAIYQNYNISKDPEITVEFNPESTHSDLLKTLKEYKVNRISMGAQSFNENELKFLGRPHSVNDIFDAYENILNAGFENISLDLIIAITNQTVKSLKYNLNEICNLNPKHISAYILKIEEDTPLGKLFTEDLDEQTIEEMYLLTSKTLTQAGYEHYEISNFAKPGFRSRHNMNYWQSGEYIAFGAGAYGYTDKTRYKFCANIENFISKNGIVDFTVEEKLTEKEMITEKIMLSLRLSDGLSKEYINTAKQRDFLKRLINEGFAVEKHETFALTPKGFLVSNSIINEILKDGYNTSV